MLRTIIRSRRPSVSWIFDPKTFCLTNQLAGYVSTDAVLLLSLRNSQGPTCSSRYPAGKSMLTSQSPAAKPPLEPVLKIKNIHCSRSLPTRLRLRCWRWSCSKLSSLGFPTFSLGERVSARKEVVNVSRMVLLRAGCMAILRALLCALLHAGTCRSHCTCTCTSWASLLCACAPLLALCTTNLDLTARMIDLIVYVIHTMNFEIPLLRWRLALILFISIFYICICFA